jgi:hypothetical protein
LDSGAPVGPTCVVRRSTSGPNGLVLFSDCSVARGQCRAPCDRLYVTSDYLVQGAGRSDGGLDGPRSCVDGSTVLRVDPPFSEDGGDGRPRYDFINIPKYGGGNSFVADVFGAIVSVPNLCDKKEHVSFS